MYREKYFFGILILIVKKGRKFVTFALVNKNMEHTLVWYGCTKDAEGCACLSEDRQSEIRQTDRTGHAEGYACLSEKQQSEIWQTNRTGHA
jgi:hypothetical protein